MSYVAFKTTGETVGGLVVINIDHIASIFQRKGDGHTSVVLVNSIGYQVPQQMEAVLEHINKSKHQTIDGALKLLYTEANRESGAAAP